MPSVTVENDSGLAAPTAQLQAQALFVLGSLGLHQDCELSVTLVGPDEMAELHERWLDEPGPTDVMSFPMDELRIPGPDQAPEPGILGDIVICPQVAAQQAEAGGHSLGDELALLLTHGMLHLLGFDHATPEEHADMFARQDLLLADWRQAQTARSADGDGGAAVVPGSRGNPGL